MPSEHTLGFLRARQPHQLIDSTWPGVTPTQNKQNTNSVDGKLHFPQSSHFSGLCSAPGTGPVYWLLVAGVWTLNMNSWGHGKTVSLVIKAVGWTFSRSLAFTQSRCMYTVLRKLFTDDRRTSPRAGQQVARASL